MKRALVDPSLEAQVRAAMRHLDHFETTERFALREVLHAAEEGTPVEVLYLDVAHRALAARGGTQPPLELAHA